MAQNSFLIKGWTLSIVVAVVALLPQKVSLPQSSFRWICLICIGAFFILDSYNIFLERCYRVKYDWVVKYMSGSDFLFMDMSPEKRPEFKENGDVGLERFSFYKAARRSISLPTVFFYMELMFFVLAPRKAFILEDERLDAWKKRAIFWHAGFINNFTRKGKRT